MKVYVGIFIVALAAATGVAQDSTQPAQPTPPTPPAAVRVFSELGLAGGMATAMKNSPFSAEEVNESVQTLADGNRIVRSSTGKMYRNSEGRLRRESHGGAGGLFGSAYMFAPSISIVDPVIRQKYELDEQLKTARIYDLKLGEGITIARGAALIADQKASEERIARLKAAAGADQKTSEELIAKLKAEGKLVSSARVSGTMAPLVSGAMSGAVAGNYAAGYAAAVAGYAAAVKSPYESKTEELGTRDFEGVSAEGTRRVTTIPVGAIGNERPIEVVYERWFSKDLGVVVYSKTTDPRSGEQTYRLTNIVRSEPDPSLFSVPTEYKKIGQSGAPYRVAPTKPVAVKSATAAKPTMAVGRP